MNEQLAEDRAVLDAAREVLRRHNHGIGAACTWVCGLTAEQRAERRERIFAAEPATRPDGR